MAAITTYEIWHKFILLLYTNQQIPKTMTVPSVALSSVTTTNLISFLKVKFLKMLDLIFIKDTLF